MSIRVEHGLSLEVELKFAGGESEYHMIVQHLCKTFDLTSEQCNRTRRIHVYFDSENLLHDADCRFRCVIAQGEWCRYDFKVPVASSPGTTIEASVEKTAPIPIAAAIDEITNFLTEDSLRQMLSGIKMSAGVVLVMLGEHHKTAVWRNDLEIEVSWDVLTLVESGRVISEIEIELKKGERNVFNQCGEQIMKDLKLPCVHLSKYQQAARPGASAKKGSS